MALMKTVNMFFWENFQAYPATVNGLSWNIAWNILLDQTPQIAEIPLDTLPPAWYG